MTTSLDIANRALIEIGQQQTLVSGSPPTFDGSSSGITVGSLYAPAVQLLLRNQDWEFSRKTAALVLSGNPSPLYNFQYEYLYPSDCLKVRQVLPATWDAFDPQPSRWIVMDDVILGVQTRVILSTIANAEITYTTSLVTEDDWDAMFAETVVRYIASEAVMPIGGRPDFSREKLAEAGQIMTSGDAKDS